MKKACVIGFPIAHSRSPLIHNHWLKIYGLQGLYEQREVRPDDLAHFLGNLAAEGYVGCNVTIPHKEAALSIISAVDDIVRRTGSLNTVYYDGGILKATSTDGEGFYQNLLATVPNTSLAGKKVLMIGAGGTSKAVAERLLRADVAEIKILNRTLARAEELCAAFGPRLRVIADDHFGAESKDVALLVNTTSQGMKGQKELNLDLSDLQPDAIVADIVYVPLQTKLLAQAEARGLRTVGGLGMLLQQAVLGFEKWFGLRPEVTPELYALVARDIEPGFRP
jgi:shikimate dehydrogenase